MSSLTLSFPQYKLYGRRQARPLNAYQQALWRDCLPDLLFNRNLCGDVNFWHSQPVCLEIGFGSGEHLLERALKNPDKLYIGCESYINGIAALLHQISYYYVKNILIFPGDARLLLADIPHHSLDEVVLLFADPWPKKRHHKRRLIQTPFIALLASRIVPGGYIHCATDWAPYAEQMLDVLSAEPLLANTAPRYAPRLAFRPQTKFESRGLRLGHGVWDLMFNRI